MTRLQAILSRPGGRLRLLLCTLALACADCGRDTPDTGRPSPSGDVPPYSLPDPNLDGVAPTIREEILAARSRAGAATGDAEAVGELGMLCLVNGFASAAVQCFEPAAGLAPGELRWRYYLALAYEETAETKKAVAALEAALAIDADYAPLHAKLADHLLESDLPRARQLYQRALELNEELPTAHYGLGRCAIMQGRTAEAVAHFQRAADLAPRFAAPHYELAMLYRKTGEIDKAREHLGLHHGGDEIPLQGDPLRIELTTKDRRARKEVRRAAALSKAGREDEAVAVLEQAVETDPQSPNARVSLGNAYLRNGRAQEAEEQFRLTLQIDPQAVEAKANLAQALSALGRVTEAERILRDAHRQHPDRADIMHRLGALLARRGRTAEALPLLRRAAEVQPADARIRHDLGWLLLQSGRSVQAAEQLRQSVKLEPNNAEAHFGLGLAAKRQGDVAQAEKDWRQAVEIDPAFANAYLALAGLALEAKDYKPAERHYRQGLKNAPEAPMLASNLAWLLATCPDAGRRDGAEAIRLAERACTLTDYQRPGLLDTLAAAYAERRRFDRAVEMEQLAIRLATKRGMTGVLREYRKRLALYEQDRPFRQGE